MFLGIHLGHDASASLIDQNGLRMSILQERHTGMRHDYGINIKTIDLLLESCGIKIQDIEAVGISSTQQMPAINQSPDEIKIVYNENSQPPASIRLHGLEWLSKEFGLVVDRSSKDFLEERFSSFIEDNLVKSRKLSRDVYLSSEFISIAVPLFVGLSHAIVGKSLKDVISQFTGNLSENNLITSTQMCEELIITIRGIALPAYYWSHHACHAASNSTLYGDERIIFTHDGGQGFQSGGFWKLDKNSLQLITLHELELGQLYDFFAFKLGLGSIGGAGKLMGLAAYGKGSLFPELPFYGTPSDIVRQFYEYDGSVVSIENHYNHLWNLCKNACIDLGLDVSGLGNKEHVTDEAPTEIAFFIQKLMEKTLFLLFAGIQTNCNLDSIGLSGGVALNCPVNSKIFSEANFSEVF